MYLEVTGSRLEQPEAVLHPGPGGAGDQSQEVTVTLLRSRVVAEFQWLLGPNTQPRAPCLYPVSTRLVDCRDSTVHYGEEHSTSARARRVYRQY